MNKIEFLKEKIPFTQVANGVLTDKRLTAKAKGLYAYLYSKPDGWDFAIDRIALEMADGRLSINNGLKELEEYGFLTRKRQVDGRVIYTVHFPPITQMTETDIRVDEPYVENRKVRKPQSAETDTVSNKDSIIIKNTSNKDIALQSNADIPVLIKEFEKTNKACGDFYGNTTQRKALEKLINAYGKEKVFAVINALPKLNRVLYNKATTPVELWNKWSKIEAEASQLKASKQNKYAITTTY